MISTLIDLLISPIGLTLICLALIWSQRKTEKKLYPPKDEE